jgi:peptidoglycan hydrolase CwlO-like protein
MFDELLERRRARVAEARLHRITVEGMTDALEAMQQTLRTRQADLEALEGELERTRRRLAEARAERRKLAAELKDLQADALRSRPAQLALVADDQPHPDQTAFEIP